MSINIDLVMAYIDSIGVDAARQKIHSYDVSGPSAEDFFGKTSVNELDLEIEYLKNTHAHTGTTGLQVGEHVSY